MLQVSTHMPLARHDTACKPIAEQQGVSTHMPLARHDADTIREEITVLEVSTHMPLARHDGDYGASSATGYSFYSHASCEA